MTLLQQAVAYQIEFNRYHPEATPNVSTLLHDYKSFVLPNKTMHTLIGHKGNVKCVQFVGSQGHFVATGSSDNTVMVWDVVGGNRRLTLQGHHSRIWDISTPDAGETWVKVRLRVRARAGPTNRRIPPLCFLPEYTSDWKARSFSPLRATAGSKCGTWSLSTAP